jgi:hypothetical protein
MKTIPSSFPSVKSVPSVASTAVFRIKHPTPGLPARKPGPPEPSAEPDPELGDSPTHSFLRVMKPQHSARTAGFWQCPDLRERSAEHCSACAKSGASPQSNALRSVKLEHCRAFCSQGQGSSQSARCCSPRCSFRWLWDRTASVLLPGIRITFAVPFYNSIDFTDCLLNRVGMNRNRRISSGRNIVGNEQRG